MSATRLALRQARYENRAFWRNPPAAFFTFAFPLMFLVIFNVLFGNEQIRVPGGTISASTFYVPAIAAFSIVTACFTNVAMGVAVDRDGGLLKRVRGTPLPSWAFVAGKLGHAVALATILVAIVTAAGAAFYGVRLPAERLPAVLAALAVGAAAFCALGLAMTAAIPNADAAPAVVNGVVLPLLFVSDVFVRTEGAPAWVRGLGELFPIKHLSVALQQAFDPFGAGAVAWGDLGIVALWGAAGVLLAVRFFSWEPRR